MCWAPASVRNMERYIRGTCIFKGENVTDKCTVIIVQFGKEHGGWLIPRVRDDILRKRT